MSAPEFNDLVPEKSDVILEIKKKATEKGFELLKVINDKAKWKTKKNNAEFDRYLQIATSESLTCGLIMSTLVDIPWGGFMKYGGFGVYDTDAKRVFNHVQIDDVYTHKCASEMAIGVLRNSNATLAIAVTGNAMPINPYVDRLGEVFLGIAGYNADGEIIYVTKAINMCIENNTKEFKDLCSLWYSTIADSKGKNFNSRESTARISQEIRYYTVLKAYELCMEFIAKCDPQIPDVVLERKQTNNNKKDNIHYHIPANKFEFGGYGKCMNDTSDNFYNVCELTGIRDHPNNTAQYTKSLYNNTAENTIPLDNKTEGGKRKRRTRKIKTHKRSI